ncbi:MAG: hypothetical protein AAF634_10255, partial [Bacteroidota bacterium]
MRTATLFFLVLQGSAFSLFSNVVEISAEERKALLDIYEYTQGQEWNRVWDLDLPVSSWHGVLVRDHRVVGLNLFNNNLNGILPESIGNLKYLEHLNLAFNTLTGVLPKDIAKLRRLRILKLEMNRFKGALPEGIGELSYLEELSLFNNFLSGPIPESFGELRQLKILNLSSNNLKGIIPKSFGNLTQLE